MSNDPAMNTPDSPEIDYTGWQRRIVLFLGGQSLSMFGSSLVQYAIMWYLVLTTDSGMMMTIYVLVGFLPHVVVSPFAGVWADRFRRKRIIMLADACIAMVTLVLAFIFMAGYQSVWLLLLVSLIRSLGGGIQAPAVSAVLPQLVPQDKLMRVNGINGSLQSFIFILSPAAGGVILTMSSITTAFFVDVVTALIGVGILATIAIPTHAKALSGEKVGYLSDLKEGLLYVKKSGYIMELLVFYAILCLFMAPAALLAPLFVTRAFGGEVWMLTVIEIVYSVGSIFGGLAIAAWGGFRNRTLTIGLATVCFGLLSAVLGIAPGFTLFALIMAVIGVSMPFANSPLMVILQERIAPDMLGRVFSLISIVGAGFVPLGMLIFGPLADVVDIRLLFIVSGLAMALLGALIYANRNLRNAGEPVAPPPPPAPAPE